MISYVEAKYPDFDFVQDVLSASIESNFWTNFASVSLRLEVEIESFLQLPDTKAVIACFSGAQALFGSTNYVMWKISNEITMSNMLELPLLPKVFPLNFCLR